MYRSLAENPTNIYSLLLVTGYLKTPSKVDDTRKPSFDDATLESEDEGMDLDYRKDLDRFANKIKGSRIFQDVKEKLTPETYGGYEVALQEKEDLASPKLDKAKAYYNDVLKDVDGEYTLKKDLKIEETSKLQSVDYELELDNELVKKYVDSNKLTNNALFNFAFAFTLSKFIYKDDSLYETIYNGRKSSKVMNSVSMFVKTLPVYIKYQEEDLTLAKVKEMQELLSGLEENDLYSFGDVANDYNLKADVIFAYQGDNFNFETLGGFKVTPILMESETPKSDFGLDVFLENGKYRAHFEWDQAVYTKDTIDSFKRLYELVLNELLTKKNIKDINCLPEFDKAQYEKYHWNSQLPQCGQPAHEE